MPSSGAVISRKNVSAVVNSGPSNKASVAEGSAKFLFVLGAGASAEFGAEFPLGNELKNRIAAHLRNEYPNIPEPGYDSTRKLAPITGAYVRALGSSKGLREAMNQIMHSVHDHGSIDDLLNDWRDRPDMQLVAKIAIALVVAAAEEKSGVHALNIRDDANTQHAFSGLSSTWLAELTRSFLKNRFSRRQLHKALERAAFINFNYDRSVERFLFHAFLTRCELPVAQAIDALKRVQIIHPYGSLGPLTFGQSRDGYGSEQLDLLTAAQQIRTYNEEIADKSALEEIRALCRSGVRTYLMGFGFHQANVDLLFGERSNEIDLGESKSKAPLFATGFRLTGQARARAAGLIQDRSGELVDVRAAELLASHADVLEMLA